MATYPTTTLRSILIPFYLLILCAGIYSTQAGIGWTNLLSVPGGNYAAPEALAVEPATGAVYLTGILPVGPVLHCVTAKYSNAGQPIWTNILSDVGGIGLAVDPNGNVIVAGSSNYDYFTIKYTSAGAAVWTNLYNGSANSYDYAFALAVDTNGNVYVAGNSDVGGGNQDIITLKYSSAGVPLWTNRYGNFGTGSDSVTSLAVDGAGNLYLAGTSGGAGGNGDILILKYSGTGTPLWTNIYGSFNAESVGGLVVTPEGEVFVAGETINVETVVLKYSASGQGVWTNRYHINPGLQGDYLNAIALDNNRDVYVTGRSATFSGNVCVTIKYSNSGTPVWTNFYAAAATGVNQGNAIAADAAGNIWVTGYATGNTGSDLLLLKYSAGGTALETNLYNHAASSAEEGDCLAIDPAGNVFVAGSLSSPASYLTLKYSNTSAANPLPLQAQVTGNQLSLSWTNASFRLEASANAGGPFTNVSGAQSPYPIPMSQSRMFFRLANP